MKWKEIKKFVQAGIDLAKEVYPEIKTGYSFQNISSNDIERLLWYVLQTYPEICKDDVLHQIVIDCARQKKKRETFLNEFLQEYFKAVFREHDVELKPKHVREQDTIFMLEFILSKFEMLWADETLLRGAALFAKTDLVQWFNNGGTHYEKYQRGN